MNQIRKIIHIYKKNFGKRTKTFKSSKFKNKKKLYVRVRAYKYDATGNKVYGDWSKRTKVKIK